MSRIAGVDEAGRGPLAGPVVAAAVILPARGVIDGLDDSKRLSASVRARLAGLIRQRAVAWSVALVEPDEIDRINILMATMTAMTRAVEALAPCADAARIDGNRCPELAIPATAVIGGDASDPAISAASILAKVTRDRLMVAMDRRFPGYGFATHKGYGTRAHLAALQTLGVCPAHRRSFAPVRRALVNQAPAGAS